MIFLSFAKLVMMSSAPAKSAGDARYASQDPLIVPYDLDSKRNKECVLSTSSATNFSTERITDGMFLYVHSLSAVS